MFVANQKEPLILQFILKIKINNIGHTWFSLDSGDRLDGASLTVKIQTSNAIEMSCLCLRHPMVQHFYLCAFILIKKTADYCIQLLYVINTNMETGVKMYLTFFIFVFLFAVKVPVLQHPSKNGEEAEVEVEDARIVKDMRRSSRCLEDSDKASSVEHH